MMRAFVYIESSEGFVLGVLNFKFTKNNAPLKNKGDFLPYPKKNYIYSIAKSMIFVNT